MSDDCPEVTRAVISLPPDYLESLIGREELVNCLTSLANKIFSLRSTTESPAWLKLAPEVFTRLGELVPPDYDEFRLLKTVFPFLLFSKGHHVPVAKSILTSELPEISQFLKAVQESK